MRTLPLSLTSLACLLTFSASAQTTITFEAPEYSIGEVPGSPFTVAATTESNSVEVADTSSFASTGLGTGSQSLRYTDGASSQYSPTVLVAEPVPPTESFTFSIDVYFPSSGFSGTDRFRLWVQGTSGSTSDVSGYYLQIGSVNMNILRDNTGTVATLGTNAFLDSWYRIEMAISPVSGTSDTVDVTLYDSTGTVVGTWTDRAFGTDLDTITNIRINNNVTNEEAVFYLDNVTVIPESSATVGIVGLLTLLTVTASRLLRKRHQA
jgi:hypothetical protein